MTITCGIVLGRSQNQVYKNIAFTHPLRATTHLAPLTGSFKKAKSRDGSHISVSVFGKYPPTDVVKFLVSFMDRRRNASLSKFLVNTEAA